MGHARTGEEGGGGGDWRGHARAEGRDAGGREPEDMVMMEGRWVIMLKIEGRGGGGKLFMQEPLSGGCSMLPC